jgi:hypothetical protein
LPRSSTSHGFDAGRSRALLTQIDLSRFSLTRAAVAYRALRTSHSIH